jgi:hypothetical protein
VIGTSIASSSTDNQCATSLLPMLVPARDVRGLPDRLSSLVDRRLQRCGLDGEIIGAETRAMRDVAVAPTVDRFVVGIMVDFAKAVFVVFHRSSFERRTSF